MGRRSSAFSFVVLMGKGDYVLTSFTNDQQSSFDKHSRRKTQVVDCGGVECYNGGQCMPGHYADAPYPLCDCSTAWKIEGEAPNVERTRFVGVNCQTPITSQDYCSGKNNGPGNPLDLFCVNGGKCRQQSVNFQEVPCNCPDGFTGRHCEYAQPTVQQTCTRDCSGNGQCTHGKSPFTSHSANSALGLDDYEVNEEYMFCTCDDGFAGSHCEYEFIQCETKTHYCFHGSKCKENEFTGDSECECFFADGQSVAGEYCEYRSTDNCENPLVPSRPIDHDHAIFASNDSPFCVNNGICVFDAQLQAYGCECNEYEWTGKRCEYEVSTPTQVPVLTDFPSADSTWTWNPTLEGSQTAFPSSTYEPTFFTWNPTRTPYPSPSTWSPTQTNPPMSSLAPTTATPTIAGTSDTTQGPTTSANEILGEPDRVDPLNEQEDQNAFNELPGSAKFGIIFLTFAIAFTLAVVIYRRYQRHRFGKVERFNELDMMEDNEIEINRFQVA